MTILTVQQGHIKVDISKLYPKLVTSVPNIVVLAEREVDNTLFEGTCLTGVNIGYHSRSWSKRQFKDYEGSITLTNND